MVIDGIGSGCEVRLIGGSRVGFGVHRSFSCAGHKMKIGDIAGAVFIVVLFGCRAASAERCAMITGPRYNLVADTVTWSMKTESDHRCLRGFRYANVEFERVTLISPPRSGQVVLQGWGFTYTPKDGFRGEDSFDVEVSGKIRKIRGTSTIHVSVSVVGAELIR